MAGLDHASFDRPLSWLVALRPAEPMLPLLREDELIALPGAVIAELESEGSFNMAQVMHFLNAEPIAGLVTDEPWRLTSAPSMPVLVADSPLDRDIEMRINREITQRHSELYRLGSELVRVLAVASANDPSLNAFLTAGASATGYEAMLVNRRGTVLGRSSGAPALLPAEMLASTNGRSNGQPHTIGGGSWLVAPVSGGGLPEGVELALGPITDAAPERARLAAQHISDALRPLLGQLLPKSTDPRAERNALFQQLIGGYLDPDDPRLGTVLGDGSAAWRLLLLFDPGDIDHLLAMAPNLPHTRIDRSATTLALIEERDWERIIGPTSSQRAIATPPMHDPSQIAGAVADLLSLAPAAKAGAFGDGLVVPMDPHSGSVAGLLASLIASDQQRQRASAFRDAWIGRLIESDRDGELLKTAQAYLETGASMSSAADRLGVHRNTLAYRLKRIGEVGGLDLSDAQTRLAVHIALIIDSILI